MLYQSSLHQGDIAGLVFMFVIVIAILFMAWPAILSWINTIAKQQAPIDYDEEDDILEDDELFGAVAPLGLMFMPIDWSGRYVGLAILIGLMASAGYILLGLYIAKVWQRKWNARHKRPEDLDE